jgi:hypothetical protein
MKSLDIRAFCRRYWQPLSLYGLLFVILILTSTIKLHTLLPGFNVAEVQTFHTSSSLKYILHHPVNAPYNVLAWIIIKAHTHQPLLYFRLVSAALGLAVLAAFCGLLTYWHGVRVAFFATLLLGTSSWFLHIARFGAPDILLCGLFMLIACGVWLQATKSPCALLSLLLLSAGFLYVPGMPWLIGVAIACNWKQLDTIFTKQLRVVTVGAVVSLAVVAPLAWDIYKTPTIARTLLNLPAHDWPMPLTVLKDCLEIPLHIFVYGAGNPVFELGHLPVFSVFVSVMFLLGVAVYAQHSDLRRVRLFIVLLIAGSIVASLGGPANIALLVPFLYLVAAAGIGYLLKQWFSVFPKNPIARSTGIGCLTLVVLLVVTFNVRQYFISWSNASVTQSVFQAPDIGSQKDTLIQ